MSRGIGRTHTAGVSRARSLLITRWTALAIGSWAVAACGAGGSDGSAVRTCEPSVAVEGRPLRIVTTVAPITDIVEQLVAGTPTEVVGVVPPGRDSHTFEPTPGTARALARADVAVMNGLDLEAPTLDLALADMRSDAIVCELGNATLPESDYLYDRTFPEAAGSPNPHLWTNPPMVADYADVLVETLVAADPAGAATYRANHAAFVASVEQLDGWVRETVSSVPADRRVLLTYHDAYAYFGREYGFEIVGAVQPSSFDEPSPRDVAELIEQIRERGIPVVFGSEAFPAPVLAQIASEGGAIYVDDLRDDVLPGEAGDPEHSWQGLIRTNVTTIADALRR